MPRQNTIRPANANYQDLLVDFTGWDFSQFDGQQEKPEEEPGFLSKLGNSVMAIGEGLTMLPGGVVDTVRDAYHGGDIDVNDADALRERQERERERAEYLQKYQGKTFEGLPDAMNSMGYSTATMGASLLAGAAGAVAGPVGAGAAGMAASGTLAYRASKQQFLRQMLDQTKQVLGRMPSQEEWDRVAEEFDGEATRYGLWEAGPEALSNLFMAKLLGPLGKGLFRGSVGQGIKRVGGLYGEELATETTTEMGQGYEEERAGLREKAPGFLEAFGEIAPATFWQTTLMAGGKKGADILARRFRSRKAAVEANAGAEQGQIESLPAGREVLSLPQGNGAIPMRTTDTGLGPIPAGAATGQEPTHLSLDNGDTVDLLQGNDGVWGAAKEIGAPMPPAQVDAAPFPEAASFTMDAMLRPTVMPARPASNAFLSDAAPAPDAVGPVNVAPVPTQAQLTSTQTAPRTDTMAQATALGMPAPDAVPQEARATQAPPVASAVPVQPAPVQASPVQPVMPEPQPAQAPATPSAALEGTQEEPQDNSQGAFAPERMQSLLVKKSRQELLNMLPQEKRAAMMKKNNPAIMAAVRKDRGLAPDGSSVVVGYGPYGQLTKRGGVWGTDEGVALADVWEEDEKGKKKKISRAAVEYASGMAEDLWYAENVKRGDQAATKAQDTEAGTEKQKEPRESRAELLQQLPPESQDEARRLTNAQLKERVRAKASGQAAQAKQETGSTPEVSESEVPQRERKSVIQPESPQRERVEAMPPVAAEKKRDPFGPAYTEFSGKSAEAIEHLMRVREGHVPAAFHKEGLGDIDLPWGRSGKKGYGLAHIIERREQLGMDGEAFIRSLPDLIREGRVEIRPNYPGRAYIVSEKAEASIRLEWDGKRRNWVVTAYPFNKEALEATGGLRTSARAHGDKQSFPLPHSEGVEDSVSPPASEVNEGAMPPVLEAGKKSSEHRLDFRPNDRSRGDEQHLPSPHSEESFPKERQRDDRPVAATSRDEQRISSPRSDGENQPSEALSGRRTLGKISVSEKVPSENTEGIKEKIISPSLEVNEGVGNKADMPKTSAPKRKAETTKEPPVPNNATKSERKENPEAVTAKPRESAGDNIDKNDRPLASIAPGEYLPPRRNTRLGLRHAAAQRVADALGKTAKNAAPVHVVQRFDDLPANIRKKHAGNAAALEGVYDPATGTVWLVADNLSDAGRVAEVWAHEQIVHHGLRGMLSDTERRTVLNQLWLSLGGMGNASISEVAKRYGLNPRSDSKARLTVMEEVLANLAEKRQAGSLDATEQGAWRKIVNAIFRAWNRLVQAVSGRSARMGYGNVDALLADLGRYVMEGVPAVKGRRTGEKAAFASVGEDRASASRAAWEQVKKDTEAWGRQLDAARNGAIHPRQVLTVGQTPAVLQKLGAPDLAMTMTQNVLRKIGEGGKHGLPDALVRRLPALLAEPVMVFRSGTQANSLVALLETVHSGMPVVAAVHLDVARGSVHINDIASVHGRSGGFGWVDGEIRAGRRVYADKTKIPAWRRGFAEDHGSRRMSGLQLPGAFVLPNDPRGVKILTEKDVVKPVAPQEIEETDSPLASLGKAERAPRDYVESIASGIRQIRKVMGRSVGEDVEEILSNPEMGRLVPKNDLSIFERLFKLPHWIAKDHAGFGELYDRQQRRSEDSMEATNKALAQMPLLFDADTKKQLGEKEYRQLAAMLNKWDGKEIGALKGIEKFNTLGKTLWKDRPVLAHNPRYKEKFDEWLKAQPEPERVKQAFRQVRGALDDAFLAAYSKLAAMSDLADTDLETYRTDFGSIHNYFPHSRKGKYFVTATMGKGIAGDPRQVVFRKHFDVPLGSSVREEWAKIVAANRKDFPGATWNQPQKVEKLPDDILGAPIDAEAMEQIIKAATGKISDNEQAQEIQKLMLTGISDILKARGFGAHGIKRQNIPGYETENIKEVLYEYIAGLNGWLTKMEAASDFAAALGKINAQKTPRLWEYASQYVKDMLRNSDQIERIAGNIKTVAFAWYLGANFKTAVVNVTQNPIIGVPRLQMYVTGGGAQWVKGAMDTIGLKYTGTGVRGARNLTADEESMLQDLYGNGVINAAYMDELQGQLTSSPVLKGWRRFIAVLGKPMAMVECFNRASLALAAYRAARAGAFRASALQEFDLKDGEKMNHEQARDFAAMLVRDSHYEYGKGNQPEFLRSNFAGRMASPIYTFRSFGFNTLNLWWRALRQEGWEGRAFVAKSLGATIALGGLTAFPFYATMAALCAAASGDDEDWTSKIRKALPESDLMRDVVCYGLPALAGVNIGGSLRMETPFTEGIEKGTTFKEAMTESLGSLFGIPYDMAVNKPSKFFEAGKYGDGYKMIEALAPTFVANAMQAYRLATEGQTTTKGRPINSPGQPGARKLSGAEAMGKVLGFQPTSSAKSYEAYRAGKRQDAVRSDKVNDLAVLALKSIDTGNPDGRIAMMKELRAWNKKMQEEGKPHMLIQPKDVLRRVKSRRRENRATPKQRQKGAAQMATWGV